MGELNKQVIVMEHREEWQRDFENAKEQISKATGIHAIEHIGSTALQDIVAKPIIDILVGIENIEEVDEKLFKQFKEVGFYRLRVKRPNEIVLAAFEDETLQVKTHFVHLVTYEGELWKDLLFFRDTLRNNRDLRLTYETIKKDSMAIEGMEIGEYTNRKEAFVKGIYAMRREGNK
ncbi:GrpB family protein [Paenalkalicoccus suaedae]|uniref:GrpB family protein n=1 Tax=Paenalkalicoccus suaedae TaxID=2592382 RepID=A0A859FDP6_9BACI|nr:GrpB family protein [Paenalkalicoccus suaedae]QKS71207.1 GrpB family protein [Paenalkalicoccus suaedae]